MGTTFAAIHIKCENRTAFKKAFTDLTAKEGLVPCTGDADDAPYQYWFGISKGGWATIVKEEMDLEQNALAFCKRLQTACISVEVVDSDFAVMACYDSRGKTSEIVVGDGSGYGVKSVPLAGEEEHWKPFLRQGTWEQFSEAVGRNCTFVEDNLREIAPMLGISEFYMTADEETIFEDEKALVLAYKKRGEKHRRKMSFDTAFKRLYAEELAPYGFQKIKGKRPYFVRMVGDEILHIITYRNLTAIRPYRDFNVLWGVATVYCRRINMEVNPDRYLWMKRINPAPDRVDFEYRDEDPLYEREYIVGRHEVSMMEELRNSVEATKREIPLKMDSIRTLRDYIGAFGGWSSYVPNIGGEIEREDDEGILNYKLYTFNEFESRRRGFAEHIEEAYKEQEMKLVNEQIELFRKYTEDEEYHRLVEEEMKRRKQQNLEILRGYGIDV